MAGSLQFTDSRNRYEFAINTIEEWSPETAVRGPTNGWIVQTVDAMRAVRPEAPGMQTPMRILQAMDDKIVDLEEQDSFCDAAPNCEMIRFGGFTRIEEGEEIEVAAKHELFTAPDQIRTGAIASALNFFARHL